MNVASDKTLQLRHDENVIKISAAPEPHGEEGAAESMVQGDGGPDPAPRPELWSRLCPSHWDLHKQWFSHHVATDSWTLRSRSVVTLLICHSPNDGACSGSVSGVSLPLLKMSHMRR